MTTARKRSPLKVRAFENRDVEALIRISRQASVIAGTLQLPTKNEAAWAALFTEAKPGVHHLVATWNDEVIGHLGFNISQNPRLSHTGWIGMMVDEAFQGRGAGGALLDAAIDLAENWCNVQRIELDVYVDNTRAIKLYSSRGFHVEGVARAAGLKGGVLVDVLRMARLSEMLAYPRLTAEDVASRPATQLPRNPSTAGTTAAPEKKKKGGGGLVH